jgi:hypothetical protein
MPKLEIEIDDKGDFVGAPPAEVEAILKRIEAEHYKIGVGKGYQQAATEAKAQIEEGIKYELAKKDAMAPLEKERVSRLESDHAEMTTKLAETMRESDRLLKSREEAHARELIDRAERLKRRDLRIVDLTKSQVRAEAINAGARDESLDELELVLNHYIGFDDEMVPFVKNLDGTPQLLHGKQIPITTFVKQYLENHPHHRKPAPGRGGDARRGASLSGGSPANLDAARTRLERDRSPEAINELFLAGRKTAAG